MRATAASRTFSIVTTLISVARQVSKLEDKLKALPAKPGVYLFRDAGGDVLYIGKAKSLRPRVRSYFQAGAGHALDDHAAARSASPTSR